MVSGRRTFVVSRGLEYFSETELQMQIGAGRAAWPAAVLKELIDNALDACESAGVDPVIEVAIHPEGFSVRDNGPGIPAETLERSLDYQVRVSDKLGYVTPTRGRLGNALKVIWAAPFVATGASVITVQSRGMRHRIQVTVDRIEQKPAIQHHVTNGAGPGTEFSLLWPDSASSLAGETGPVFYKTDPTAFSKNIPTARELVEAFAAFNPHAAFRLDGEEMPATAPGWRKWKPDDKLVAHWYTTDTFRDLVAHYVASERYGAEPITVRGFVAMFRGLSSTQKQKAVTDGFKRDHLHELVVGGDLDEEALETLLARMKEASRAVKPAALGAVGKNHLTTWMVERANVVPDSIQYRKKAGTENDLPYVIEIAFGVSADDEASRRIVAGLNWSPTLDVPAREIREILQGMRVDPHDPVVVAIHMARPAWNYTGRGKETVAL